MLKKCVMLKKVVSIEALSSSYCRPGEGSHRPLLECGHYGRPRKMSQAIGQRAHCEDCSRAVPRMAK